MYERYVMESHPDVELGIPRKPIEYFVTRPSTPLNNNTGLLFTICGYGQMANEVYWLEKLNPYLADQYNCLVVNINYYGINRTTSPQVNDNAFALARNAYGYNLDNPSLPFDTRINNFLSWVHARGIQLLDARFNEFMFLESEEYNSFGFLPALDHLMVLGRLLKDEEFNHQRIMVLGTSYGGYIGQLMGKFAPNTFAVIIDNSGFSRTRLGDLLTKELWKYGNLIRLGPNNEVNVFFSHNYPWTIYDETSPYYFSDACRCIRSLLHEKHRLKSSTRYYVFHSVCDNDIAPIADKDKVVEQLKRYNSIFYKRVTAEDIDGRLFKNLEHGMDASLKGIFNYVADLERAKGYDFNQEGIDDFKAAHTFCFSCGLKDYIFEYNSDYQMSVSIVDHKDI
ncbi:MAG: DUF2920 family protein [Methylocystaceae bacterium]